MEVIVEKIAEGGLEYKIEVTFTPPNIEKKIQKKLNDLSKSAKIPGFRPKKIPLHVVKLKYADEVTWDIVREETQRAYQQALSQEKITPAGAGVFEKINYDDLQKLSFTAVVETMPTIDDFNLDKMIIDRYLPSVQDEDIDQQITQYQRYECQWESKLIGSQAEEGDQVIIDFDGCLTDGSTFDGGCAKDYKIILGTHKTLPEFEKVLYGAKQDEQKKTTFAFPMNYGKDELAGKEVTFNITIKAVNQARLPALDDADFLAKVGIKEGGTEALISFAKTHCKAQLEERLEPFNNITMQNTLLALKDFPIPKVQLEEEKKSLIKGNNNSDNEPLSASQLTSIEREASRRCKMMLIYGKMTQQYHITVDAKAVNHRMQHMCNHYFDGDFEAFSKNINVTEFKQECHTHNIIEQIHDTVYKHAKVNEIFKRKSEIEALSKQFADDRKQHDLNTAK